MKLKEFLAKWGESSKTPIAVAWISDAGMDAEEHLRVLNLSGVLVGNTLYFSGYTIYGPSLKVDEIDPGEEIRKIYVKRSIAKSVTLHVFTEVL